MRSSEEDGAGTNEPQCVSLVAPAMVWRRTSETSESSRHLNVRVLAAWQAGRPSPRAGSRQAPAAELVQEDRPLGRCKECSTASGPRPRSESSPGCTGRTAVREHLSPVQVTVSSEPRLAIKFDQGTPSLGCSVGLRRHGPAPGSCESCPGKSLECRDGPILILLCCGGLPGQRIWSVGRIRLVS